MLHEGGPELVLAVHERFGGGKATRRPPLDEVGGQRKGRTREANERHPITQLRLHQLYGPGHESEIFFRYQRAKPSEITQAAHGTANDRPDPLDKVDIPSRLNERRHDVGEENGCVHSQPAYRLQRDLSREFRMVADLHERALFADGAKLRQRATGLPHKPNGGIGDRLTPTSL